MSARGSRLDPKYQLVLSCLPGVLLQLGGVGWALRSGWDEVNLLLGVFALVVGTALVMFALERYLAAHRQRDSWAWAALLGPLGPLLIARLEPGKPVGRSRRRRSRSLADRLAGTLLTALVTVGVLWAASRWLQGHTWPKPPDEAQIRHDEALAYERLLAIAAAQERYRERDWDGDGQQTYAVFHVHLWRTVDPTGRPVAVELIPRELGFAMARAFALDNYVYQSVHVLAVSGEPVGNAASAGRPGVRELDPATEWGVIAKPAVASKQASRVFFVDQTGEIWTHRVHLADRIAMPTDLASRGWVQVRSAAHLAELQRAKE